uniref:Uncharacterized protein n=1 Tax=Helianthus annuus TaxID=4232 RepID=A0A251SFX7_HELAN
MDWYHKGSSLFSHLGLSQMCSMLTFLMVDRFLSFLDIIETTKGKLQLELIFKLEGSMIVRGVKTKENVLMEQMTLLHQLFLYIN